MSDEATLLIGARRLDEEDDSGSSRDGDEHGVDDDGEHGEDD